MEREDSAGTDRQTIFFQTKNFAKKAERKKRREEGFDGISM
jgi:hypothetical protein